MTVRADAYDGIRRDALVRIERRRLRPEGDLDEVQSEMHRAVDEYQRRAHLGDEIPLSDPSEMIGRVLRSITDFGPLTTTFQPSRFLPLNSSVKLASSLNSSADRLDTGTGSSRPMSTNGQYHRRTGAPHRRKL